ncbi:MAG TPA: hypothetical protein VJK47_01230 [Dehalococcoidales bacterium]|nr:hypothetical protein [Dehalococcoidales bacterium]
MFTCRSVGVAGCGVAVVGSSGAGVAVVFVVAGGSWVVVEAGSADAGGVWGGGAGAGAWFGSHPARRSEALNKKVSDQRQTGLRQFFIGLALLSRILKTLGQARILLL